MEIKMNDNLAMENQCHITQEVAGSNPVSPTFQAFFHYLVITHRGGWQDCS